MSDRIQSYNCQVCNISCSGPENLSQHFESAKHKKKAQQAAMFGKLPTSAPKQSCDTQVPVTSSGSSYFCQVCDAPMTGIESYATHMAGARHRKNVHKLEAMEKLKGDGCLPGATSVSPQSHLSQADSSHQDKEVESLSDRLAALPVSGTSLSYHYCQVCQVPMSGPESLEQHYKGSKHFKNIKRQECISTLNASAFNGTALLPASSSGNGNQSVTEPPNFMDIQADENATDVLRMAYNERETESLPISEQED